MTAPDRETPTPAATSEPLPMVDGRQPTLQQPDTLWRIVCGHEVLDAKGRWVHWSQSNTGDYHETREAAESFVRELAARQPQPAANEGRELPDSPGVWQRVNRDQGPFVIAVEFGGTTKELWYRHILPSGPVVGRGLGLICLPRGGWRRADAGDSDLRERLAAAERERDELRGNLNWVCRKLDLPDNTPMFVAGGIAGKMHVMASDAHGMVTYIKAYKCDDKQGEIARLAVRIAELDQQLATARAELAKLREALLASITCTPGTLGGRWRIAGTRMPIDTLIELFVAGQKDSEILKMFASDITAESLRVARLFTEIVSLAIAAPPAESEVGK